jgi:hypothetical protein
MLPIGEEAGCVLDLVLTLWSGQKSLALAGNRTPAVKPVVLYIH